MNTKQIEEAIATYVRELMNPQEREDFLISISGSSHSGKAEVIRCFFVVVGFYEGETGRKLKKKLDVNLFDVLLANLRIEFRKEIDDLPIAFAV